MLDDDGDGDDLIIVIDNGSSMCKAGFAGGKTPCCCIPTAIGKPHLLIDGEKSIYIGEEINRKRELLTLSYPVERGVIRNFEDMEKIWHHLIYDELRIKEPFSILLTEPPANGKANREQIAEIMFEKFKAVKLNLAMQPELSLLASARTTGVVIDSGERSTNIVSIHNGRVIRDSLVQLHLGGRDLDRYLLKSLTERGEEVGNKWIDITDMKRELCYIPIDYEKEVNKFSSDANLYKCYETPSGEILKFSTERFQCPEILFQPSLIKKDCSGIHHAAYTSISKCPVNIQEELYSNIICSGGNTMFRGIAERTKKEISNLALSGTNVKVIAPPERLKSVWIGGSIMGSVSTFQQRFITKEQYEENGFFV